MGRVRAVVPVVLLPVLESRMASYEKLEKQG